MNAKKVADLLIDDSKTMSEKASVLGINRITLWRWRKTKEVKKELRKLKSQIGNPSPEKIRKAMSGRGLKHKWVAKRINLKPNTFTHKLSGRRKFKLYEIYEIAKILGCKPKDLME